MKETFRKKLIILLKITGVLLSLLIAGLATFYLVDDIEFWYIYLAFLVFGLIFIFLFSKNFKETEQSLVELSDKEKQKLKNLLDKIEEKERYMEKRVEKKLFGK